MTTVACPRNQKGQSYQRHAQRPTGRFLHSRVYINATSTLNEAPIDAQLILTAVEGMRT